MSAYLGPPSLWITINPSDLSNPIAQLFAGENIDLDNFLSSLGPDSEKRAKNIAEDPYAASKFFHFLIRTILETLFQVKIEGHRVKSGMGILGRVAAYFGLVESQGRGTLHLHLLIWLLNAPTGEEMEELLKSADFRDRVVTYIHANIRSYAPGLDSAESLALIPNNREVGYSRLPNPNAPNYDILLKQDEILLARVEQLHTCKPHHYLVSDKFGHIQCKRRAPFPCSKEDFVHENGEWGSKWLHGYINGWIPGILVNARCNNDGKLLTNGGNTKNITYYVTTYAAKKQGKSYNTSAVLAQGYAYHHNHPIPQYIDQLHERSRLLIFRLVHAINREQELAAPMVISYLMGWGDAFKSHTYSSIFWSTFLTALFEQHPSLSQQSQ